MSVLAGYDDDGRGFDASALLQRPAFWAVHLGIALGCGLDDDLAALFGVDARLLRGTYLRLTDDAGWPVLPAGDGAAVVYRNDEQIVDYLLLPPGGDPITIAEAEGVPDGPALSWPELSGLAARVPDPLSRAHALLLLAPLLGDATAAPLPGDATAAGVAPPLGDVTAAGAVLRAALRTAGVTGDGTAIAARIVAARPARWRAEDGVRICDHPGSVRHPGGSRAATPAGLRAISAALNPTF
ncbi:hypothetical protein AB0F72_19840 [Actinoplanes sp. NPDC023936]|uniref:hypothetical protein n=1 Tax=Actinoplanes sp. NPDC023936 TaxID=3154910 RepID=UPI0033DD4C1E